MRCWITYCLLLFAQMGIAQTYEWESLDWIEPNYEQPYTIGKIEITADDEKVILGYYKEELVMMEDTLFSEKEIGVFLAKLDANDNLLWLQTIAQVADENSIGNIPTLILDQSGNIYASINYIDTLFINSELFPAEEGNSFALLVFNPVGEFIHHIRMEGNCSSWLRFRAISTDSIGNLYLLGGGGEPSDEPDTCYCSIGNEEISLVGWERFTLKLHNNQLIWIKTFDGSGAIIENVGRYNYITGTSHYAADVSFDSLFIEYPNTYDYGAFMVQQDTAGNFIWAKYFGQQGWDSHLQPLDIEVLGPNDIVLVGRSFTQSVPNRVYFENAPTLFGSPWGSDDYFLVNYDSLGNVKWHTIAKCDGWDRLIEATHDENKNIYLAGTFTDQLFFADDTLNSYGTDDVMVLAFDSLGNELWAKHAGGTSIDQSKGISIDSENNLYVVGGSASATSTFGSLEHSLTEVSMFYAKMSPTAVAIPEFDAKSNSLQLYPNPTNSYLQLNQKGNKTIYNLLGEEVLKTTQTNIDVSLLPQGIYILQWENQQKLFMKTNIEN